MNRNFSLAIGAFPILFVSLVLAAQEPEGAIDNETRPAFKMGDVEYFRRFTEKDLHEYTPKDQEDLEKWADMVSINYYNTAKDGEALAGIANAVLENYKKHGAVVIATKSVPRTEEKPAEHLIVVRFSQQESSEVVFARFRLHKGIGTSVIYSHRFYGDKLKDQALDWLKKNSKDTEKIVMKWDEMPALPAPVEKKSEK